MLQEEDRTVQTILERLSDLDNRPEEEVVPYREFNVGGKLYYFMPGGFLYCRDPGTEVVGASPAATFPVKRGTIGPTTGSRSFSSPILGSGSYITGSVTLVS